MSHENGYGRLHWLDRLSVCVQYAVTFTHPMGGRHPDIDGEVIARAGDTAALMAMAARPKVILILEDGSEFVCSVGGVLLAEDAMGIQKVRAPIYSAV
jgi:hypothetical protein